MTAATAGSYAEGKMTSEQRMVIFASSLGTVFEWYDFYIYGTLGVFLAKYFFSNVPANVGFIFALLAFAGGQRAHDVAADDASAAEDRDLPDFHGPPRCRCPDGGRIVQPGP